MLAMPAIMHRIASDSSIPQEQHSFDNQGPAMPAIRHRIASDESIPQGNNSWDNQMSFEIQDLSAVTQQQMTFKGPSLLSMMIGENGADSVYNEWRITLWLGPGAGFLFFLVLHLIGPAGLAPEAMRLAGVALWLAVWWMTEALPLGVASMLPLAAFPLMGIATNSDVSSAYSSTLFWLFFGGIQLSLALERTGLHKRIALIIIRSMGTRVAFLMLGLNLAVGLLSMFLSNTSTTVMLLPVATALVTALEADGAVKMDLKKPFMLGLAYSASAGGIGTVIGTPPNGVLVAMAFKDFGIDISFAKWSAFAIPFSLILLAVVWVYFILMYRIPFTPLPAGHPLFEQMRTGAGPVTQAEVHVGIVFGCTVFAWMTRSLVEQALCLNPGFWADDTIAIVMVISLFIIKAEYKNGEVEPLMDWKTMLKMPWDLFFLFGGGLAMADGFRTTGLSAWLGDQLSFVEMLPRWATIMVVVFTVTFLTEVTSNVATANVWLPIVGQMSINMGKSPLFLMIPTTVAASCAYMLPVATPPNAIVFGSGFVTIRDMARTGFLLSLIGVVLVTLWNLTWGPVVFDFDNYVPPPIRSGAAAVVERQLGDIHQPDCQFFFGWL